MLSRSCPFACCALAAALSLSACGTGPVVPPTDAGASVHLDAGPMSRDAASVRPDAALAPDADLPDAGDPCAAVDPSARCDAEGATSCTGSQSRTCALVGGCLVWGPLGPCPAGLVCALGSCHDCRTGDFHDLSLSVDGEARHYFLHVPQGWLCDQPLPLMVDFHGTAGPPAPEEAYGLSAQVSLADQEGFAIARPRSRSSVVQGSEIYRWDENPGDIARNTRFTELLVGELKKRLPLDEKRLYAAGFSSGTNMASQLLGDRAYSGIAGVGGGVWNAPPLADFGADAPRLYEVTGYRDYMFQYLRTLLTLLSSKSYPMDRLFRREDGAGHDLYGWHYREMWSWMDKGVRPPAGTTGAGWTRETVPGATTLLSLARRADGTLVAAGTQGTFFLRDAAGAWTSAQGAGTANYAGICLLPSGAGIAVGEGAVATTADGGATWTKQKAVPEYFGQNFGYSYLNTVACSGTTRIIGGGYWSGVQSDDSGQTWRGFSVPASWGGEAQIASMRVGPGGTALAAGYYDYIARSVAGADFAEVTKLDDADWWNGVAAASAGNFWVVGEAGAIVHSADDGATFQSQRVAGGDDLYAVSFFDAQSGVAVGVHGYAVVTHDGGTTWTPTPTGLDGFLADVMVLDAHTAVAVGEGGALALSF